jgi:hypothetical protein
LEGEAVPSSDVDGDSGADRHSVEGEAPSSVLVAVADSNMTAVVDVVEAAEDVVLAGETTSPSATVMRQFRSSLSGLSWRRLTSLAWAS